MRRWIYLVTFFLLIPQLVEAQYYNAGQDPGRLKWLKVESDRFSVIYPESYGDNGVKFLNALERGYDKLGYLFPEKKFKIPIVIHSYSSQANGTVVWAPKRMEIFPAPSQNGAPIDNFEELSIHELTHVLQMNTLDQGVTKVGRILFGEQFIGLSAAAIPSWYLEGHAVFTETLFTESGRGRSPSFFKYYKAISIDKGNYKYDKMALGSYKDFVPNHYYSGYQTVTAAIRDYGDMFWSDMLSYSGRNIYLISPMHFNIKKKIGLSKEELMVKTFDDLAVSWKEELKINEAVSYPSVGENDDKRYVGYQSPVFIKTHQIAAIKTSLSETPKIVLLDLSANSEKTLLIPGNVYPYIISTDGEKIVWVETEYDPRWKQASYSVLKSMDISTKKVSKLSHKTRYLSVGISPYGNMIAAIENNVENINSLVFIDATSGEVIAKYNTPENIQLQRPHWSDDGQSVICISLNEEGEGIVSFSLSESEWKTLRPNSREDYQTAFLSGDTLFYVSSLSGTENGYMMTADGRVTRLTNSRFGITDMTINGGTIWFSDYTSAGNKICYLDLHDVKEYPETNYSSMLINQIPKVSSQSHYVDKTYEIKPYRKATHFLNFHSLLPFYVDIDNISSDYLTTPLGVTLYSQNVLGTTEATLGYEYDDGKHLFHTKLEMMGKYPVFTFSVDRGNYVSDIVDNAIFSHFDSNAIAFSGKMSIPLLYNAGRFTRYFLPSVTVGFNKGSSVSSPLKIIPRVTFYNYRRMATRDIYPKFGQFVDLIYYTNPMDRAEFGDMFSIKTAFYFPGFISNSGFRLRYETDYQDVKTFIRSNLASVPRGTDLVYAKNLQFVSVDYAVPLFYPDISLSSILYIKRIRANLFYDYARYCELGIVDEYLSKDSKGIDLLADFHLFRLEYQISGGIRSVWNEKSPKPKFEAVFVIDIYGTQIGGRKR